jgi:hypothetical protein
MLPILLPACLAVAIASPSPLQGQQHVTEVFSIQHLLDDRPAQTPPPWGTLLQQSDLEVDLLGCSTPRSELAVESVVAALQLLLAGPIDGGSLYLAATGQSVLAVGEAKDVARVGACIRAAGAMLARPLQVEFAVWDAADRETCPAILSPAEFAQFAGGRSPLSLSRTTTRGSAPTALRRLRWVRYVRDLHTEVAQKQAMVLPSVAEFGEGAHAAVQVFPLLGDEFAVELQFAVGQRRGVVRTLQTGMAGAPDLELPTLETDYGACSGRIPNGGALAVTLRGNATSGGQRILTLRVAAAAPQVTTAAGLGFAILPCGALTGSSLQRRLPDADDLDGIGEPAPGSGHLEVQELLAILQQGLGDGADAGDVQIAGGLAFVRGDGPRLGRVENLLRGLQDRLVRNATVAHAAALQASEPAAGLPPAPLYELQAPTLFGRLLVLGHSLETNAVIGIGYAIAQEAGILDPVVEPSTSGVLLHARAAPADDGAHLQMTLAARHAPPAQARSVMPGGVLMATDRSLVSVLHDGVVANGVAAAHGDGPAVTIEGRGYRSALATTLRW